MISHSTLSGVKRGSFAQSTKNRKNPSTFVVGPGPAAMTTVGAFAAVRSRVLWQTAQLLATRGKPITFFVNPTGSSWPCSHGTPCLLYTSDAADERSSVD